MMILLTCWPATWTHRSLSFSAFSYRYARVSISRLKENRPAKSRSVENGGENFEAEPESYASADNSQACLIALGQHSCE